MIHSCLTESQLRFPLPTRWPGLWGMQECLWGKLKCMKLDFWVFLALQFCMRILCTNTAFKKQPVHLSVNYLLIEINVSGLFTLNFVADYHITLYKTISFTCQQALWFCGFCIDEQSSCRSYCTHTLYLSVLLFSRQSNAFPSVRSLSSLPLFHNHWSTGHSARISLFWAILPFVEISQTALLPLQKDLITQVL